MTDAYIGIKCIGFRGPRALPHMGPGWKGIASRADKDMLAYRVKMGESVRSVASDMGIKLRSAYYIVGPNDEMQDETAPIDETLPGSIQDANERTFDRITEDEARVNIPEEP